MSGPRAGDESTLLALRIALAALAATIGAAALASAILGFNVNAGWYAGLLVVPPGIALAVRVRRRHRWLALRLEARRRWAKSDGRQRDLSVARWLAERTATASTVDERTWADLRMEEILALVDRTVTRPGEAMLYRMLRNPLRDAAALAERAKLIRLLADDAALRESVVVELLLMGRAVHDHAARLLWGEGPPRRRPSRLLAVMPFVALASVAVPVVLASAQLAILPILLFLANLGIHYRVRARYAPDLDALTSLVDLIGCAERLGRLRDHRLEGVLGPLARAARDCATIRRKAAMLVPRTVPSQDMLDVLGEYLRILLLADVNALRVALADVERLETTLAGLYEGVGELDALQSAASYRAGLGRWAEPAFSSASRHLELEGAFHPLLREPVAVSVIAAGRGMVVTGSNMAGKSTFLRTVATAVLFAQTIATVPATRYCSSLFRVATLMGKDDALSEGKSTFAMEAERLLLLMNSASDSPGLLCALDEPFSGTNVFERSRASHAALRHLAATPALVLVATHDTRLAERLGGLYDNYHFAAEVVGGKLVYDYRLRPGICRTTNAIRLLEGLGYPRDVIADALGGEGDP